MNRIWIVISIALLVTSMLAGCANAPAQVVGGGPEDGGSDGSLDASYDFQCGSKPVSLAQDLKPKLGCSGEMCHGLLAQSPQSLHSWWVGKPSTTCTDGRILVTPGDPSHSYVMNKLTNHELCGGSGMPRGFANGWNPLPTDVLQAINDWICQGAKDN